MTITPLPAKGAGPDNSALPSGKSAGAAIALRRMPSKLDRLIAHENKLIAERDAAKAGLAELLLKAGKAKDAIVVEERNVAIASTALAERADDPAAMRDFQDATARLAAAKAAAEAFQSVVLPRAEANLSDKQDAVAKAHDDVLGEKRRLAVGPRIAAARNLVAAGQALLAAMHDWDDAGKAVEAICLGRGPRVELWRAIYAMPGELEEIFRYHRMSVLSGDAGSASRFVRTEIDAWGVGDPTADEEDGKCA